MPLLPVSRRPGLVDDGLHVLTVWVGSEQRVVSKASSTSLCATTYAGNAAAWRRGSVNT